MKKTKSTSPETLIARAALRLAASGWNHVTWDKIAKAVKMSPAKLREKYKSTSALAPIIAAEIDRAAFAQNFSGNPHDILFDIVMARFDEMQKHRQAILAMADAAPRDSALGCAMARAAVDGVYRVIDAAKITAPARPILAIGIGMIYSAAFVAWRRDNSRDMAKTMAALDRALGWAEKAMALFKPRSYTKGPMN